MNKIILANIKQKSFIFDLRYLTCYVLFEINFLSINFL